jgi:hypothetical protein
MIRTKPSSASHVTPSFHAAARISVALFIIAQTACNSDSGPPWFVDPIVNPSVATSLVSNTSATLSAGAGFGVLPPSVKVKDQWGVGMGGVAVTFVVSTGGGTVGGGSATTNSSGIATVGSWILGPTPGMNTLTASVVGLPSVTFTAIGRKNPAPSCVDVVVKYEFGATTSGTLGGEDCLSDAVYTDFYSTVLSGTGAYVFKVSATFDAYLYLGITPIFNGGLLAYNDNESSATTNSAIKALLPPGTFALAVTSVKWGDTGSYSLSSATTSSDVTGCEQVFTIRNVSLPQNIQTTDCLRTNGPVYADEFFIYLEGRQPVTVSMASTAVDSFLEVFVEDPATGVRTLVASNDNDTDGTKDAKLVFSPGTTANYVIRASTAVTGQTGGYTLGIY